MAEIFERASRLALRFPTSKGEITTEDLWKLSLENLDAMARKIRKEINETSEESLLTSKVQKTSKLQLAYDIIVHIVKVRLEEKDRKEKRQAQQQKLELLQETLMKKEIEKVTSMSEDDIRKTIADLQSNYTDIEE